jgi:hypothetical protein
VSEQPPRPTLFQIGLEDFAYRYRWYLIPAFLLAAFVIGYSVRGTRVEYFVREVPKPGALMVTELPNPLRFRDMPCPTPFTVMFDVKEGSFQPPRCRILIRVLQGEINIAYMGDPNGERKNFGNAYTETPIQTWELDGFWWTSIQVIKPSKIQMDVEPCNTKLRQLRKTVDGLCW